VSEPAVYRYLAVSEPAFYRYLAVSCPAFYQYLAVTAQMNFGLEPSAATNWSA